MPILMERLAGRLPGSFGHIITDIKQRRSDIKARSNFRPLSSAGYARVAHCPQIHRTHIDMYMGGNDKVVHRQRHHFEHETSPQDQTWGIRVVMHFSINDAPALLLVCDVYLCTSGIILYFLKLLVSFLDHY